MLAEPVVQVLATSMPGNFLVLPAIIGDMIKAEHVDVPLPTPATRRLAIGVHVDAAFFVLRAHLIVATTEIKHGTLSVFWIVCPFRAHILALVCLALFSIQWHCAHQWFA
jgi:hypothetical protein